MSERDDRDNNASHYLPKTFLVSLEDEMDPALAKMLWLSSAQRRLDKALDIAPPTAPLPIPVNMRGKSPSSTSEPANLVV